MSAALPAWDGLAKALAAAEARRESHRAEVEPRPRLPLAWLRQAACLSVPASDGEMVRKALQRGTAAMPRLMAGVGVTPQDVADRLGLAAAAVEQLLARPQSAPMVMLDLEDGQADGADVRAAGVANASEALGFGDSREAQGRPLRYLRPISLDRPAAADELLRILWAARRLPDAVVLPKVREPAEVTLALDLLEDVEAARKAPRGSIRLALMVESGSAVLRLADITERAGARLCGLIFGLADFAAELGLPQVDAQHPTAIWARTAMVAAAGAMDVPAIDAMTFTYPVAPRDADAATKREALLAGLEAAYRDARGAQAMGMSGKLVGHPGQLFATLLAFEAAVPDEAIEAAASALERYSAARDEGHGATMIDGRMADLATDRHARKVVRAATAAGRFAADRADALGVIDAHEAAEVRSHSTGTPR